MVLKKYMGNAAWLGGLLLVVAVLGLVPDASAAGPVYWDWPKVETFVELDLDGATVDAQGFLMAGMAVTSFSGEGPEVYWRAIADGRGGYFTGTGHGGKIMHTDKNGGVSVFAELEGAEVFSLLLLDDGSLLAGCGPEGEIYRMDKKGNASYLDSVAGGYAWSMIQDQDSKSVFIAAGSPAAVYRLDKNDALELVKEFPAQNALDITLSSDGGLLVATQGPGLVYQLDSSLKKSRLLLEMEQDEARQFLRGPGGGLYVIGFNGDDEENGPQGGLSPAGESDSAAMLSLLFGESMPSVPRSAIYHLQDDGTATPVWTSETEMMIAAWVEDLGWLGGGALEEDSGQSILYALDFPAGEHPLAMWDGGDILDILPMGKSGSDADLIVCQAFPGSISALGSRGQRPHQAMGSPLDGGQPISWGRLSWAGIAGKGKLKWSVRGGNRSEPDDSWTDWTSSWTSDNHDIDLDPCRFIQWRVTFPQGVDPMESWRVTKVSVSAWQDNQAPVIAEFILEQLVSIDSGSMLGGSDNLTQVFRSGLFAEFSRSAVDDGDANPALARMTRPVHIFSWHGLDAENDRLLYTLQYRKIGTDAWRDILKDSPETLGSWDTSEVMDGNYEVQLLVSDRRDNPYHLALSSKRELGPFKVDNKAPVIESLRLQETPAGFRVRFTARDASSAVAMAQIQLPDGTVERLDPRDGICDSSHEEFDVVITWPRPGVAGDQAAGPWLVGVGIQDLEGNSATAEGEVR